MAHKTPLASWLYSKRSQLNPRFREFNWPSKFQVGVFDFSTTIAWNGVEVEGRGVDSNREITLEKSVAEAIERLICTVLKFDSVGFAVAGTHDPDPHAQFEALERHFLKLHIDNRASFETIEKSHIFPGLFENLDMSTDIHLHRMATPPEIFGVVCSIRIKHQLKSVGFALSRELESSVKRATLEALPNFAWTVEQGEVDANSETNQLIPWHIGSDFLDKINLLLSSASVDKAQTVYEMPELLKVEVPLDEISILNDAPIRLARYIVEQGGRI